MGQDKETKLFIGGQIVLYLATSLLCFWRDARLGITATVLLLAALLSSLLYLRRQTLQLRRLSARLERILERDFSLDIQDYTEGELSILKSKIYKVTVMLSEQADLLQKDKTFLADMLSDISHQLKTPLTSMTVMTDLLENPDLPPEKREEFLVHLRTQLERIQWLVSSLLRLSKLDAGAVPLIKERISLAALVEKAKAPLLIPIELKNLHLTTERLEDVFVWIDSYWTAEAVLNILKNCMEHTPAQGVLSLTAEENPIYTALHIRDTGVGIAPEDLPHIFERFYRGKNAAPDSVGIGLAMAQAIVEAQGGKIEVSSTPGEGTEFVLKFYRLTV